MRLLVINGPNINLLGLREPDIYGKKTYADLLEYINLISKELNIKIDDFQSNYEGAIVEKIQNSYNYYDGIIINPAAYTHTSIAILDALKAVGIPTVEVHLSKVSEREDFRQVNFIREFAIASFEGYGIEGYNYGIKYLLKFLGDKNEDITNR